MLVRTNIQHVLDPRLGVVRSSTAPVLLWRELCPVVLVLKFRHGSDFSGAAFESASQLEWSHPVHQLPPGRRRQRQLQMPGMPYRD